MGKKCLTVFGPFIISGLFLTQKKILGDDFYGCYFILAMVKKSYDLSIFFIRINPPAFNLIRNPI